MPHDPFPDVPDPEFRPNFGRAARDAQGQYEHVAVAQVCALLGASHLRRTVIDAANEMGLPGATFAIFDDLADFPIRFRVGRLRRVRFVTLPDLFDAWHKTPMGWGLLDIAAEVDPADGPIGLIFNWPGMADASGKSKAIKGGKFMVAHTYDSRHAAAATRITRPMVLGQSQVMVTVETLAALLATFDTWQSGDC